jgi:hypothetical protein
MVEDAMRGYACATFSNRPIASQPREACRDALEPAMAAFVLLKALLNIYASRWQGDPDAAAATHAVRACYVRFRADEHTNGSATRNRERAT